MMVMDSCKYIDDYIKWGRTSPNNIGKWMMLGFDYVEKKLSDPDVFIDNEKIEIGITLIEEKFKIKLLDWELYVFSLIHAYYKSKDAVVFDEFLIMMGRGNGKNGFISPIAWYLTTPAHGIKEYNVDIVANSEDQAKTSFEDVYNMLDENWKTMQRFFYKSKEVIKNLKTRSYIKFNTSNARTKDGKRSGCLIFDEIHEYENFKMISVFTSGFGKKKHSRAFYITTQGYVREGVLDNKIAIAEDVLTGRIKSLGMLPLLYCMDSEKEVERPEMWHKANPSLKYFAELEVEMNKEYIAMKYEPHIELEFYTKRMNLPRSETETPVTDWKNIIATEKEMPDLKGQICTCGIDYAKINDIVSVNLHFNKGDKKYDINHSWLCKNSKDFKRIVAEKFKWEEMGLLEIIDDVEISPKLIANYIKEKMMEYNITKICVDNFRYTLLAEELGKIGFTAKEKNLVIARPSDIYKIVPVIESYFAKQLFIWGVNPLLRWATNNTCVQSSKKKTGVSTGSFYYAKIEEKSRKTDPFLALVHSVIIEEPCQIKIDASIFKPMF